MPHGTFNSSARVAYIAHGQVNSVSNIIVKHRHGLVTDCHHLPMVPIVSQSAPMVSVADVSVKLYYQVIIQTIMLSSISIMLIYALTPSFRIYIRDIYEIYMRYIYIYLFYDDYSEAGINNIEAFYRKYIVTSYCVMKLRSLCT